MPPTPKGKRAGRAQKTLVLPASSLGQRCRAWPFLPLRKLSMALGLQPLLQTPAQTPSITREKGISSKAVATLLTPTRMAGMVAEGLLSSGTPFSAKTPPPPESRVEDAPLT